jgi:hypothetical protein
VKWRGEERSGVEWSGVEGRLKYKGEERVTICYDTLFYSMS